MTLAKVYVGIGANLGNRVATVVEAAELLKRELDPLARLSPLYETEPRIDEEQPVFVNAVIGATSTWQPERILTLLQQIEHQLGRRRDPLRDNGPRNIDLDLLLVGDQRRNSQTLKLPHPDMHRRRFVLQPLADITHDPLPIFAATAAELLAVCGDRGWVEQIEVPTVPRRRTVA